MLTSERRGEIAIRLVVLQASHTGLPSKNDFKRRLGEISKETEVPHEELLAFFDSILPDILRRTYKYEDVDLKTTRKS